MERGAAVSMRREVDTNGHATSRIVKKGVKDFNFGRTLGEGSYSTVLAATGRQTLTEYAIKVLDKRHIIKEKKVKYVNIEKNTLNRLGDHPGIVRLYYTFQDERSLYFVLDLAAGGELLGFVKKVRKGMLFPFQSMNHANVNFRHQDGHIRRGMHTLLRCTNTGRRRIHALTRSYTS